MADATPPRRPSPTPPRILTAVPLCDGHDSAIMTINQELVRRGAEVVYLGYHQPASAIARAAIQEDVHAVGISSYNGGHLVFFREVLAQLRDRGGADIKVFGGGGGTITPADARQLQRSGVERIFHAGTPLEEIAQAVAATAKLRRRNTGLSGDRRLAREITRAETAAAPEQVSPPAASGRLGVACEVASQNRGRNCAARAQATGSRPIGAARERPTAASDAGSFVLGVTGPGGAGKSTLIDELTSRFLRRQGGRIAVLANDPSHVDHGGALLGDRVTAIYAQNDRVFFRSLATRGSLTGVSAAAPRVVEYLRASGAFELIVIESVGIGQDGDPFGALRGEPWVDATLFVTPPHYGGRVQLEKIPLLRRAGMIALNKCDDPRAETARVELTSFLARQVRAPLLHLTTAADHQDPGVDALFAAIADLAEFESPGGERACQLRVHAP